MYVIATRHRTEECSGKEKSYLYYDMQSLCVIGCCEHFMAKQLMSFQILKIPCSLQELTSQSE
jgi:hypothetical protein